MASEIRVNSITNRSGLSTITFSDTGVVLSGVSTFSSGLIVSAGTTAAPSISPTGDSNTGIFFPSADTIAFGEGGTEALRIDSSGNLGIGTNNPSNYANYKTLEINGTTSGLINLSSSGQVRAQFLYDGTNIKYDTGLAATEHIFGQAGTERARFTSSGLKFPSGLGIDFSATSQAGGMTSELLADYEEGTWTPVMIGTSAAGSWSGSSANGGFYVKIGRQVTCWANVNGTLSGASGDTRVTGLPYTRNTDSTPSGVGNAGYSTGAIQYWSGISVQSMGPLIEPPLNRLYFHTYATNSTSSSPVAVVNGAHNLHFFVTYFTA